MSTSELFVRPMTLDDTAALESIVFACYSADLFESTESLRSKLERSPDSCFVACKNNKVLGYLIAIPALLSSPPLLNTETKKLPEAPDTLYLHDLALMPECRGTGIGAKLVAAFFAAQRAFQLPNAALVAVQNSAPYWQRYGFISAETTTDIDGKINSYGWDASYMVKSTP
jgi:ribosomal protein S18 acetylase RimI-like enzyme